jgi:hypothetical protein
LWIGFYCIFLWRLFRVFFCGIGVIRCYCCVFLSFVIACFRILSIILGITFCCIGMRVFVGEFILVLVMGSFISMRVFIGLVWESGRI